MTEAIKSQLKPLRWWSWRAVMHVSSVDKTDIIGLKSLYCSFSLHSPRRKMISKSSWKCSYQSSPLPAFPLDRIISLGTLSHCRSWKQPQCSSRSQNRSLYKGNLLDECYQLSGVPPTATTTAECLCLSSNPQDLRGSSLEIGSLHM